MNNQKPSEMEYHVSVNGDDGNPGTATRPLRTIQAAAALAMPGDTITVHEGVYRERVDPPRGGLSDEARIVYRAAPGEKVAIKGSEPVKSWKHLDGQVWMTSIPNDFFGGFNPYANLIAGNWFYPLCRDHHTGAVYLNDVALNEAAQLKDLFAKPEPAWFAIMTDWETKIWAAFGDANPNEETVEINVRQTVFYPSRPGINYLTLRGFTLSQAATPWAPPLIEQIGLVGVNWSKGWIIEENTITHSRCAGITLGKYFDRLDGKMEGDFNAHHQTVKRVLDRGDWTQENIGSHIVRNNHIAYCEQAGIVGSHGGAFCTITGNVIHDIHVRRLFNGFEQAGIKLHAPVDTVISNNLIYNCVMGIWLDWMVQGTRVTKNLFFNNRQLDLFVEISHGPYLIDNNWFLSNVALLDSAQGGAYVHNCFGGKIEQRTEPTRATPYFDPHSTRSRGLGKVLDGDERFYNNIFLDEAGLQGYDGCKEPVWMDGNVFVHRAMPSKHEPNPLQAPEADSYYRICKEGEEIVLELQMNADWREQGHSRLITTELLGKPILVEQGYEHPDGTPLMIDTDYYDHERNPKHPFPGPVDLSDNTNQLQLWPIHNTVSRDDSFSGTPIKQNIELHNTVELEPTAGIAHERCQELRRYTI